MKLYIFEYKKIKEDTIQGIKEAKVMFNNKNQLLCSNSLGLGMKKKLVKKLYLEFCCLWIRNRDRRGKWREGRKWI
jgi:hypothetical protein